MKKKVKPTTPSRAVGYVRISVDRPDETSTETQDQRIRAYCVAHGLDVVDVVVETGRSAFKASRSSRPGFRRAMGLVTAGAADTLICWKLDRACRDTRDTLALVDELAELGARFVSVTEHFDTATPTGRLMITMLAGLAEMESATKSERVQEWQDRRRTIGATPTGPRPYGYRRERNRLHIDKAEAAVIRKAAAKVLAGEPLRHIVRDLNASGAVGKSGQPFQRRGLAAILTGPTVAAMREVDGAFVPSDAWEPILDSDTWRTCRDILTDPSRRSGPGNGRRWLLSGIAVCGKCDDEVKMQIKPHLAGPRYYCPKCGLSIEGARTDEVVEHDLLGLLDPAAWRRLRQGRPVVEDTSGYEAALAELTARFAADDIGAAELAELAEGLRRQRKAASTPAKRLPDIGDLAKAWPKFSVEQRRIVLSAATESLTIRPWTPGTRQFDETRIVWVPVA
jgi:site-specific DNA recombinase